MPSYDEECLELAKYFLIDTIARKDKEKQEELAQHIQDEIERWLKENNL